MFYICVGEEALLYKGNAIKIAGVLRTMAGYANLRRLAPLQGLGWKPYLLQEEITGVLFTGAKSKILLKNVYIPIEDIGVVALLRENKMCIMVEEAWGATASYTKTMPILLPDLERLYELYHTS